MYNGKMMIVTSLGLIGVCLWGMFIFMESGKYAVAQIWFPAIIVIGIVGLTKGIEKYRAEK